MSDLEEDGQDLHELGAATLAHGSLRLVSSRWLALRPQSWLLERCQDLDDDAFVSPYEAAELFQALLGVVVLSYGWFSRSHPDTQGHHLRMMQKFLKCSLAAAPGLSKAQPECYSENAFQALMWDYMSLPQLDRTESEEDTFTAGIQALGILYGSPKTLVVQLKDMVTDRPFSDMNSTPYSDRGWCTFEEMVSSILKPDHCLLDLCIARERLAVEHGKWFDDGSLSIVHESQTESSGGCKIVSIYLALERLAATTRHPPMAPKDFESLLQSKDFTDGRDLPMVAKLYGTFFRRMCRRQPLLMFVKGSGPGYGWEKDEAVCFAKALPAFRQLRTLSIEGHHIGDDGLQALAYTLPKLPALSHLSFKNCYIGEPSLKTLANIVPKMPELRLLVIPRALQESELTQVLVGAWSKHEKPKKEFDAEGWPKTGIHWVHGSSKSPSRSSLMSLSDS